MSGNNLPVERPPSLSTSEDHESQRLKTNMDSEGVDKNKLLDEALTKDETLRTFRDGGDKVDWAVALSLITELSKGLVSLTHTNASEILKGNPDIQATLEECWKSFQFEKIRRQSESRVCVHVKCLPMLSRAEILQIPRAPFVPVTEAEIRSACVCPRLCLHLTFL